MLNLFCCPRCQGRLTACETVCSCAACGSVATLLSSRMLNYLDGDETTAKSILEWSDDFLSNAVRCLQSVGEGKAIPNRFLLEDFKNRGLIRANGELTPLGRLVSYHSSEYKWQDYDVLEGQIDLAGIGKDLRLLDIGSGAGQSLRRIDSDAVAWKIGIDIDLEAIALGIRLAQNDPRILLARASAHALPFSDFAFDVVLMRTSINYVCQRYALREAARVLKPGGLLLCRTENIWWDFNVMRHQPSLRAWICRLRDFGYGTFHGLTRWQPEPGSSARGGRAFATHGTMRSTLKRNDCEVVRMVESGHGPRFFGHATQFLTLARKLAVVSQGR